mmetsp:Transcript_21781/g.60545  ORF Transcript_21781/g.60545 Transcript_21781/m.60545 type:complete len:433 (-) Transcript_21781:82-1380(-)
MVRIQRPKPQLGSVRNLLVVAAAVALILVGITNNNHNNTNEPPSTSAATSLLSLAAAPSSSATTARQQQPPPNSKPPSSSSDRQDAVCRGINRKDVDSAPILQSLCDHDLWQSADDRLHRREHVHFVQIGAHTGFEKNDPMAQSLSRYFQLVQQQQPHDDDHDDHPMRDYLHWHFVEPSPPNFQVLQQHLQRQTNRTLLGPNLYAHNLAIVPSSSSSEEETNRRHNRTVTFYTLRASIDPVTGRDRATGQQLPFWVTQVSSLDQDHILTKHRRQFARMGVPDPSVLIREIAVPAATVTELMQILVDTTVNSHHQRSPAKQSPQQSRQQPAPPPKKHHIHFVLIDTEGYDCKIIAGMPLPNQTVTPAAAQPQQSVSSSSSSSSSSLWPPSYLLYETMHCDEASQRLALGALQKTGYHNITRAPKDNVAILARR